MKQCAYCGRENADDASRCSECVTAEFRDKPSRIEVSSAKLLRSPISKCHESFALTFLFVGPLFLFAVTALVTFTAGQVGLGGHSSFHGAFSPLRFAVPCAFYFIGGVIASLLMHPWVRIFAVVVAHVVPLLGILLQGNVGPYFFLLPVFYLPASVLFGYFWFRLLREARHDL